MKVLPDPKVLSSLQEELLLSILPKHIADEMLQGIKNRANQQEVQQQQFNTMYMYRHENVRSASQNQTQEVLKLP